MESSININSLKERFYNQHFKEYRDFLHDTDLSPRNRRGLSKTLNRLNEQVMQRSDQSKNLFPVTPTQDRNNPEREYIIAPRLKLIQNELNEVVSVEEFFSIVGQNDSLKEKVNQILLFIEKESGNGTIPELQQTTEDTILRSICDYFWKKYDKKDIVGKDGTVFYYNDLKNYRFEEIINVISGIITSNTGIISFLHICRKIRNNDVHNEGILFGLKDGYDINCFRLFTYMGTVLLLRMCLEEKGFMSAYQFDKMIMPVSFPEGSSCDIKLFSGKEIIPPRKTKRKRAGIVEYEVEWYRPYRLEITKYNVSEEKTFEWGDFSPIANFDGAQIKIDGKESQAPSNVRNRSFQHVAQSIDDIMNALGSIETQTGNIDNTVSSIDSKLDIFLSFCKVNFDQYIKQQNVFQEKLISSFQEWIKKESKANTLQEILELLKKQYQLKEAERENKRKKQKRIYASLLSIVLLLALTTLISNLMSDNSVLWLTNKPFILCVISFAFLLFGISIYGWYRLSTTRTKIKSYISICIISLLILFLGGSYYLIPYKTAHDLVENYEFAIHVAHDNVKAVEYMERLREEDPGNGFIMAQLTNYYLNYSDCIDKAIQVSRPLEDVAKYDYLSEWAALCAYQNGDYEKSLRIIDNYNKCYNRSTVTMNTLYGAMFTFGKGVEQDITKGIGILIESSKADDGLAQYYLGHFCSYDNSMWDYSKTKIPYCDLKDALYYYRKASKKIVNASLELANIYADLGMNDSANYYYNRVIENTSKGDFHNEALYRMGLINDIKSQTGYNNFLSEAISRGYTPAIIYYASKQKDDISSINAFERIGVYRGYRYISPVAIKYLEIGAKLNDTAREKYRQKAKTALLECRPDGKFDDNFILGVECLLGLNHKHNKDTISGMNYMSLSARQGCRFADMICEFYNQEKALSTGTIRALHLEKISESIPFAHVLLSYLFQKANLYRKAIDEADYAMRKGHPGGSIMFVNLAINGGFGSVLQSNEKEYFNLVLLPQLQRALRITKQKEILALRTYAMDYNFNKQKNNFSGIEELPEIKVQFWSDIAIANSWKSICIELLQATTDPSYQCKLIDAILMNIDNNIEYDLCVYLSQKIEDLPEVEKSKLKEKYKNNDFAKKLFTSFNKYANKKGGKKIEKLEIWTLERMSFNSIINEFSEDNNFIMPQYLQ